MRFEKADRPKRSIHVIWSPSRKRDTLTSRKVERVPIPLSDEIRFEFYRPATSEQGGVYAEA